MEDPIKVSAEKFVDNLFTNGEEVPINVPENVNEFPEFCNKQLFKKGQKSLFKYAYCLLMSNYFGLLASLSIESCRNALNLTGNTSTAYKAYRRYVSMTLHIFVWYYCSTRPNSRFWKSINIINARHKRANDEAKSNGKKGLSQKDLALMQFGFIGFLMARPHPMAYDVASKKEVEGLHHMWYIMGHFLGIEDRYNICTGSVEETRAICELLIEKVYLPGVERKDPEFLEMSAVATKALWYVDPLFETNTFLTLLYHYLTNTKNEYIKLTFCEKVLMGFINWSLAIYRWWLGRFLTNCVKRVQVCYFTFVPFIAAIRFGWSKAVIKIIPNENR